MIFRFLKTIFVRPFTWYFSLSRKRKWIVGGITFLTMLILIASLPILLFFAVSEGMIGKMPSDDDLMQIKNYQASEIYSSDSVLLGRYFVQNRSDAAYEEISSHLFNAIIATEDARFYEHKGVDTRSLIRVLFKSVLLGRKKGGGSTLSQQLAKNLFGRKSYGLLTMPVNKIREAIIANQLEKLYSKKEILTLYVNTVSFGEDTYGIKTSTQRFFSTTPDKLLPEQAAVMAGMLKSPTFYNPRRNPDRAEERRNVVLEQMHKYGYLTAAMSDSLRQSPLIIRYNRSGIADGLAPYFRERVRQETDRWLAQHPKKDGTRFNLYTDGLKIYTTLHSKMQVYAEQSVNAHLASLQPALQKDLKARSFFTQNESLITRTIRKSARYQKMKAVGFSDEEIMKVFQTPDSLDVFTPEGKKTLFISPLDSVKLMLGVLQAGFIVVNPRNGNVLAWVGGADFEYFQYDHIMAKRQAGSVFKPIVYASALQSGVKPCDFIANRKITYTQYENWAPQNANEKYEGRYSVAGALANSVNTISVQLCMQSGIQKVIELAGILGIQSKLPEKPSIALGTADMNLWELTGAYTAFANEGLRADLNIIMCVLDNHDSVVYRYKPVVRSVFKANLAHDMTNMLRMVVDKGTAHELRDVYQCKGEIAGKTGTTQDHRDGWFMGYTGSWLAGVWVGADNPSIHFGNMSQGRGSALAMPVWAGFYKRVMKDPSLKQFASASFQYPNTIDCELYKDDNLLQKIFGRKNKVNSSTGLEEKKKERLKKRKRRKL